MAKRKKKAKKRRPLGARAQVLRKEQISIIKEAGYIVKLAQRGDARVVTIGGLVFFSTSGGDAWVLDPEDNLALCLAEDGELPFEQDEMQAFFKQVEENDFPVVHHSSSYEDAYRPAYRVIKQEYLETL